MEVNRYAASTAFNDNNVFMLPDSEGAWVYYEDHEIVLQRAARLESESARLRRCLQWALQEAEALVKRLRLQLSVDWSKESDDA